MADRRDPAPGPPVLWDRLAATAVVGVLGYACLLVVRGAVPAGMFDRLGFGMTASGIVAAPARDHVLLVYGVLGAVLIGWMVLLLAVVLGPLRRRESRHARRAIPEIEHGLASSAARRDKGGAFLGDVEQPAPRSSIDGYLRLLHGADRRVAPCVG